MSGVQQALENDIDDFLKQPRVPGHLVSRFGRSYSWFHKILLTWYKDVTEAGPKKDRRKCLNDKFPNDSPGNLDKESVFRKRILGIEPFLAFHILETDTLYKNGLLFNSDPFTRKKGQIKSLITKKINYRKF